MYLNPDIINDSKYYAALGRFFTPIVLNSIENKGKSGYLSEVCRNSGITNGLDLSMSLSSFFDIIYEILFKNYRNEYIYKNTLANKILLGKHSLNTSHLLTEFRVDNCKVDTLIINGTSTAYEIKSEYDSFNRLENQINSYLKAFDHINVITTKKQADKLLPILHEKIGILILNNRGGITTIRHSKTNKNNIVPAVILDSLRKQEYLEVIKSYYGDIPHCPNTKIYDECKILFSEIPPSILHDLMIKVLFKRKIEKQLKETLYKSPLSLTAYILSISNSKAKLEKLIPNLEKEIGAIIS